MTKRNVREERRWAHYSPRSGSVSFVADRGAKKASVKALALPYEIVVRVTILVPTKEKK